ncbi:MAG: hypothetical protein A2010_12915 [Nitrospirae bacterium GWD2_57_9]|nr:MAG: hypothetical protein A2010_12915 [Nitrospirae bacterium GWD2_57_9]
MKLRSIFKSAFEPPVLSNGNSEKTLSRASYTLTNANRRKYHPSLKYSCKTTDMSFVGANGA